MRKRLHILLLPVILVVLGSLGNFALANVSVTPASGGTSISADKAQNAASPAFTTLGNIVISEVNKGDFASSGTLILTAPAGWRFNSPGSVTTTVTGGSGSQNLTVNSVVVTASTITLNLTVGGTNKTDILTIIGVQVQATNGATLPAAGNILRTAGNPGTATVSGIVNGSTNFGSLSQVAGTAKQLAIQAQPSATATAGVAFGQQPAIQVRDQFGNVLNASNGNADNTTVVTATRSLGTGTLQGTVTATASNGVATFLNLSHNVANTINIAFTSGSLTSVTSNNIVVSPGAASQLAFVQQPSTATAGQTITPSVTVQLKDAFDNNVSSSGVSVTMTLTTGTGTLSGTTNQTTNASGIASFNDLSINLSGTKNITASGSGLTSAVSTAITINASTPTQLAFVQQPTTAAAGASISPSVTVQLKDTFGNDVPASGTSITITLTGGTGTLSGTTTRTTNASGLATFDDLSINLVGSKNVTASSAGFSSIVSSAFSIDPATATQLAFVQHPSNANAGAPISPSITVQLKDNFGNNVSTSGVSITMTLTTGSGTLSGTTSRTTNASGIATFDDLSINLSGSKNLTASGTGLTSAVSNAFTISPLGASQLAFVQQPTTTPAGQTISPAVTVQVRDIFGNDVDTSGISITMSLSSGTGTLSGTTVRTTTNGLSTFNDLSVNLTGVKQLTASASGLTSAVSDNFTIGTVGSPTKVVFIQQPSTTIAGNSITPAVTVQLRDGLDIDVSSSGVSVTVALTSGAGTLSGTLTQVTNASGLATFNDLSINLTGAKQITATSTGLTSAVSNNFTINAAAATQLAFVQQPTNATAGAAISPAITVQLRDTFGNDVPSSGVTVTMALTTGTGALSGTANRTTNVSGLASFNDLSIDVSGSKNLTASSIGLSSAISSAFTISAGAFTKLQLLVPGETAAPGTPSGKTGTPPAQTAGTAFSVTVNAVDANWNIVSTVTDVVGITSSDANAMLPANAALVGGTKSFSVTLKTAGTATVTVTDISDGAKTPDTSPSISVNTGAFVKLQLLVPGETAAPGTASGKTGTPTARTAGTAFNVTVNAVDANWNLVNTVSDVVGITSTDVNAVLPSNALLSGGTRTFSVTLNTAGTATVTASDVTDGSKTLNTSPTITVNAGAFTKLQLIVPGETEDPGSPTGKTGTPNAQVSGGGFSVTVHAVDDNWNVVSSTDVVGITSSDPAATLPGNAALVAGTQTFNVTLNTSGVQTVTASDITNPARTANTSPSITVSAAGVGVVTPATGGGAISADNVGGPYTNLTGPVYTESSSGNAGVGTIVLNAPSGFTFDTGGIAPTVLITRVGGGGGSSRNINGVTSGTTVAAGSVTATQIAFTITSASNSGVTNSLTWQNVRVRPTGGTPLAAGDITKTGSSVMTGVTNGSTSFGTLTEVAGTPTNLIITFPGETFVSGSGNSGSPDAQTAGTAFTITSITATDQFLNTATSYGGIKTIGYSGPTGDAVYTTAVSFSSGVSTTTLTTTLKKAQTTTITANDGSITGSASSTLTVNPGAFTKLQLLVPGETAVPGTVTGKTGSPTSQTVGTSFNVTVNAVDDNWNLVNTATDVVRITSSDGTATLPANAALVSGTMTFSVTLNAAGSHTITASDITQPSRTANTSPSISVSAGAFVKLQILVPGETAAPGTPTGKTGSPTVRTAGTSFNVTVNAVDANWNVINTVTDVAGITSSDANALLPPNAALVGGTGTFAVTLKTAGTATVTATDITDGTKTFNTSPSLTVNPGAFSKLQVLLPGESAAPGTVSGKTGTPDAQVAGGGFTFTVNAVDANWNHINSVTDVVQITSSDGAANLPANAALSSGTQTFSITFNTSGSQTVTASDVTDPGKAPNTSSSVTVNPAGTGTVTPAAGGGAISADNAGGSYTGLTGPVYTESTSGNAGIGTIILNAPSGFQFDTGGSPPTVLVNRIAGLGPDADNINGVADGTSVSMTSVTSTQLTFTITSASTNGTKNSLTWQNVRVRPTAGTPLAGGDITKTGASVMTGVTNGTTNFGTLTEVAGAVNKLVITLPNQTFTAGSGNSGTVVAQTAGTAFTITKLTATDQFLNIVTSYSGARTISYSGPTGDASYTTGVSFTAGQSTTSLTTVLDRAQTTTISASDGTTSGPASSSLTVNPGTFTKLQLLVPGETAAPGTASGKTGTPVSQSVGAAFSVVVNAVDAYWNPVSSTDIVAITSSDAGAVLPANAALVGGTQTFSITFNTAGSQTITASDVTQPSKTANTSPPITVTAGAFTKLQILLPGETAAPGTPSGKTGTPAAQTSGTPFTVTVNAVDANWNVVSASDVVSITSTDVNATMPSNAALVNGTQTFNVTPTTAGTATLTASDVTQPSKTPDTSPSFTVNPGAFTKLQVLVLGETAAPGTSSGKTGTPLTQTEGAAFAVTVNAVDANWNLINTVTDVVHFTSSDPAAALPADAALVAGAGNFSVTFNTAGTQTVTVSDVTQPSKTANTSPSITVNAAGSVASTATGGLWSASSTWVGGAAPSSNSNVIIATTGGNAVTLDVAATIRTLTINSGAILQGSAAVTLSLGKNAGTDFNNNGTFDANSATVRLAQNSQWAGSGAFNLNVIDFNAKTVTFAFASPNTVKVSGAGDPFLNVGTLSPGVASIVEYNGTAAQSISSSANINFNGLKITNSAGVTLQKNLTAANITGNLTISSGGLLNTSNGTTAFSITGAPGTTLTVGANSRLDLGSTATAASAFPTGFATVSLDPASTIEYSNSSTASQTVSATPTYGNILFSGSGAKSLAAGTFTVAGNWTNDAGATVTAGAGTVVFAGSNKTIGGTTSTAFGSVTISGTYTINVTISVSPLMSVTAVGSMTVSPAAVVTVTGDLENDGLITNNGTLNVQ